MEKEWKKDFSNLDYEYVAHEMVWNSIYSKKIIIE